MHTSYVIRHAPLTNDVHVHILTISSNTSTTFFNRAISARAYILVCIYKQKREEEDEKQKQKKLDRNAVFRVETRHFICDTELDKCSDVTNAFLFRI